MAICKEQVIVEYLELRQAMQYFSDQINECWPHNLDDNSMRKAFLCSRCSNSNAAAYYEGIEVSKEIIHHPYN